MKINTRNLITAAVVGALYAVLTMVLAPISYGALQFRVSEVLCILPFFMPFTAWGLFVGCIVANLMSTAGVLDVVFGSLATLITCLCIAWCGKKGNTLKARLLACLMPVVWNGLIVGATLTIALAGLNPLTHFGAVLVFAGEVARGERGVMYLIGLPLMTYLPKQRFFSEFVDKHS